MKSTYGIFLYDPHKKVSSLPQIRGNKHSEDGEEKKIKKRKEKKSFLTKNSQKKGRVAEKNKTKILLK